MCLWGHTHTYHLVRFPFPALSIPPLPHLLFLSLASVFTLLLILLPSLLSLLLPLLIPARSQRHNTHRHTHSQQNTQRSNFTYIRKIVCITVRHAFYSPPYIFATAYAILAGKASLLPNPSVCSSDLPFVCTFVTLAEFASL